MVAAWPLGWEEPVTHPCLPPARIDWNFVVRRIGCGEPSGYG